MHTPEVNFDISRIDSVGKSILPRAQIQKIYSSQSLIYFSIRKPGKTMHLYLSRGPLPYGIFEGDVALGSEFRLQDNFLNYLRKFLGSSYIYSLTYSLPDCLLHLNYLYMGKIATMTFAWRKGKLYFTNTYFENDYKCYIWWKNKYEKLNYETSNIEKIFSDIEQNNEKNVSNINFELEKILLKENDGEKKIEKKILKSINKKKQNIEYDLNRLKDAKELKEKLLNGEIDFKEKKSIKHGEYSLKLPFSDFFKNQDYVFKKIKSFESRKKLMEERLASASFKKIDNEVIIENKNTKIAIQPYRKIEQNSKLKSEDEQKLEFSQYKIGILQFAIGNSASGNDQMRSKWASKNDFWLHLDNHVSSHGIIKSDSFPEMEILSIVASAICDKSNKKFDLIPIIITQVKNLKGVKGSKGTVNYKKEKRVMVKYVSDWKTKIT